MADIVCSTAFFSTQRSPQMIQLRKTLSLLMALTLSLSVIACSSSTPNTTQGQAPTGENRSSTKLPDGQYPLQQATYNDANGEYNILLLNTPPGSSSSLQTANLPLARLTDADIAAGKKSFLKVENNQPSLYLTQDYKIEYVHNVTETRADPQTGQPQTVVVRQESSFWSPFFGSLAGAAIGNALFRPQYYVPPVYSPGGLSGYGGYGNTYDQAVGRYQSRYSSLPPAVSNNRSFRSTGRLNSPSTTRQPVGSNSTRSSGSGFGSSTLRPSDTPSSGSNYNRGTNRSSGFGSGRSKAGGRRR
jgi:hypothetical protein